MPRIRAPQENTLIRMRFALLTLRNFGGFTGGDLDALVVGTILDWIDSGMNGPVPWPDSPFFKAWAKDRGWSNVNGFIGFKFIAELLPNG